MKIISSIYGFIKYLIITLSVVFLYNLVLYFISLNSSSNINVIFTEAPILLLLLSLLYFPNLKIGLFRYMLPIIPVLVLYVLFDGFYSFFNRSPRFSDFQNLSSVFDFYPLLGIGVILLLITIPISIVILVYLAGKSNFSIFNLFTRSFLILLFIYFITSNSFSKIQNFTFKHIRYSQVNTIKANGRISSFLFYSNLEEQNKIKLLSKNFTKINIIKTLYPDKIIKKPNIHFIVLESFINPKFIKGINFNKDPLADELRPYLLDQDSFSTVISPVYGGRTAQAEFELLTGIQALGKFNSIEFNVMNGKKINGFIKQLTENNYNSIATIATSSNGFNSKLAYNSLGFNKTEFLEESTDFIKDESEEIIFDGDVYKYNLKKLKDYLKNNNKPIFNYILGIYGHIPYRLNLTKRPKLIQVEPTKNEELERISNQFYYRTKALGQYIKQLLEIDPNALICVMSDHLPSILDSELKYKYGFNTNIGLLIFNERTINISNKKYYEIPWLIWDKLADTNHRKTIDNNKMESLYFSALAESL